MVDFRQTGKEVLICLLVFNAVGVSVIWGNAEQTWLTGCKQVSKVKHVYQLIELLVYYKKKREAEKGVINS